MPPSAAATVRGLEAERLHAMVAADVTALDRLWADDLEYGHANGVVEGKAQFLARLANGSLRYRELRAESLEVRPVGDTVLASGTTAVRAESGANVVAATLRFLSVYARRDGRWQLVAYQSAALPPPAPAPSTPSSAPR